MLRATRPVDTELVQGVCQRRSVEVIEQQVVSLLPIMLRQPLQRRRPIALERRPVHQRDRRRLQRGQPA